MYSLIILQGCQERVDSFNPLPPWSAFRSSDYGYSRIKVHNATHLNLQQVSDDLVGNQNSHYESIVFQLFLQNKMKVLKERNLFMQDGEVIDDWWLIKEMPRVKFPLVNEMGSISEDSKVPLKPMEGKKVKNILRNSLMEPIPLSVGVEEIDYVIEVD